MHATNTLLNTVPLANLQQRVWLLYDQLLVCWYDLENTQKDALLIEDRVCL